MAREKVQLALFVELGAAWGCVFELHQGALLFRVEGIERIAFVK